MSIVHFDGQSNQWSKRPVSEITQRIEAVKSEFTDSERLERIKRMRRNERARARNAIIREMCGTSARAAREDGGVCF